MPNKLNATGTSRTQLSHYKPDSSTLKVSCHSHSYQKITSQLKKETGLLVKLMELFNFAIKVKQGDQVFYVRVSEARKHTMALFENTKLPTNKPMLERIITDSFKKFSKMHGKGVSIEHFDNNIQDILNKKFLSSLDIMKWVKANDNHQPAVIQEFVDIVTAAIKSISLPIGELRDLLNQMMITSTERTTTDKIVDIYVSPELLDLMKSHGEKQKAFMATLPERIEKAEHKTEQEFSLLLDQLKEENGLLELTSNCTQWHAYIDRLVKDVETPTFALGQESFNRAQQISQQFTVDDIPFLKGLLKSKKSKNQELSPEQLKYGNFQPENGVYNRVSGILKKRLDELEASVEKGIGKT